MKFKKVIVTILAASATLYCSLSTVTANSSAYSPKDIDFHWAEEYITELVNADILKGYQSKTYPDSEITRGEFCALTARALSLEYSDKSYFTDITPEHMFYSEINALANEGLVMGTGGGKFSSDKKISREEIMLILSRCIPESTSKITFKDIATDYIYIDELESAVGSGIISGYTDNTFRPHKTATRAECASMLFRLMGNLPSSSKIETSELAEDFIKNNMNNISSNIPLAHGRASGEILIKEKATEAMHLNKVYTQKNLTDLKLEEYKSHGMITQLSYTGNIDYITTGPDYSKTKSYSGEFEVKIIRKNNVHYVYDYTLSLKKKDKINLTWEVYSTPPQYAPEGVNVISPSSFQISSQNLGVESRELLGNLKFYNSLTRKYMNYAKNNNYEVWPIYKTDFSLGTSDVFLNSSEARHKAIGYIIDFACKYGIDGINIDFENIYEKNRHLVSQHARELSVMLHEMGLIVSADITKLEKTSANWSMCYDRNILAENCDYIMLMAYDEYHASSKSPGPVSSLDWTEASIKQTLKEVPADKLILAIPFYMRYFETQNGKVTSTKAISMQTAYDLIQKNNPTYTYMEDDRQYKISWKKGNTTCLFWLENTDTIANRVKLAKDYSLAGIASWRRGLEISKAWSVINTELNT